ncbi:MAG: transglutaminase domain-containing protein [Ekhidna sp.]
MSIRKALSICFLIFIGTAAIGQLRNKKIFDYVSQAPASKNIDELVEYLENGAFSKQELAEALAYWMMLNIQYDIESFVNNTLQPSDWQTTFSSRKAVCSGYSELYKELCFRTGIWCQVINGYAKGNGFVDDGIFERPNHAWNVIELNGVFHLMDITWASGYVNLEMGQWKYVKISRSKFLFVEPEKFIESHLPCQRRWQLLNQPITMKDFKQFKAFKKMNESPTEYYHYEDSIAHYMDLSPVDKKIKNLQEMMLVNPKDVDIPFHYERIAFILSKRIESEEELKKSKKFYQLAEELHREPLDKFRCKRGIEYVEFCLAKL